MNSKESVQNVALIVTGSKAPVLVDVEGPSKGSVPMKPTPPQGGRRLHSARSTKIIHHNAIHNSPNLPSSQLLSFSAAPFSVPLPLQHVPISVVLDADLPRMSPRKQSVIFSRRKEDTLSLHNSPRILVSRGCILQSLSAGTLSQSADPDYMQKMAPQSFFQVDATSAKMSPRPPASLAPTCHSKPKSPRLGRQIADNYSNTQMADSAIQITDPEPCPDFTPVVATGMNASMRMKRRLGSFEVGALDMSELPEEIRKMHDRFEHGQSQNDNVTPVIAKASSPGCLEVSHAKRVSELVNRVQNDINQSQYSSLEHGQSQNDNVTPVIAKASSPGCLEVSQAKRISDLENRVQNDINQSQYNRDFCQQIVMQTIVGTKSTLKFAFPHSSPAQLFIASQPMINLGETTITTKNSKAAVSINPVRLHTSPATHIHHSVDSKETLSSFSGQHASPRQKNTFFVQKDTFVLRNIAKSNPRTTPYRESQQPILFNTIGPEHKDSVHAHRAADGAMTVLEAKHPQASKTFAEHQKYHMMCNNRVPDFFLAAMHRK
jgi:hypothetical protein